MNFKKLFDYSEPIVAAVTIFVVSLFIIVLYGAQVLYTIQLAGDTIETTGSAKEAVEADEGRLILNVETRTGLGDQQAGTLRVAKAIEAITTYLTSEGLTQFETPAGSSNSEFFYPQNSQAVQTGYTIRRSVVVRSGDIETLSTLANDTGLIPNTGLVVTSNGLELTYSKLAEMRVKLLTEAIKDATARANAIAQNSGRTVGPLRNATGGVVQVLPQGGIEISDYGSYDTTSVNKEIMVTTRATFGLE